MKYHDKFGFLNIKESFDFDGGKIDTVEEFDTSREWIYKYENSDGFIYPPQERQIKINSIASNEIEDIPHTTRPALIHKLPNSHSIHLVSACNKDLSRNNHSGFIVHLLSYLYGTRLQFDGWWFDGRVPIKPTHNFSVRKCVTEDFLSKSYSTYKEWSAEHRAWFLNILIMHSRAPLYEWDWERFSMEYMVFDGLYRLASEIHGPQKGIRHKDRFCFIFDKYGIPSNDGLVDEIYSLRNGLFHQALWNGGQPCSDSDAIYSQLHLSRINSHIIPAILGYNNKFVHSPWWTMGRGRFDSDTP